MIPEFHKGMTIGEKYKPAMEITDPKEAHEYFEQAVKHTMSMGKTREEAIAIERSNFGYFSGYYNRETRKRVQRLFHCQHPIFGSVEPTAKEAFEMGKSFAKDNIQVE